jgi:hypothetical protein
MQFSAVSAKNARQKATLFPRECPHFHIWHMIYGMDRTDILRVLMPERTKQIGLCGVDSGDIRRGTEQTRPDDQLDSSQDNVTLSNDRHTMTFNLSASSVIAQTQVIIFEQLQVITAPQLDFNKASHHEKK